MFLRSILSLLALFLLFYTEVAFGWKMEADKMVVSNTGGGVITHINFRQSYSTIPLVFTLATDTGGDPSALRIINVSTTGFDVYSVEPDGNDGAHAQMSSVPYIAIEPGSYQLPNGTKIVAGSVNTQRFQSRLLAGSSWQSVGLSGFSTIPVVIGQIQTRVNERTDLPVPTAVPQPWVTTSINNITSSSFDIALGRAETTTGTLTNNETIAYLAIDSGLNSGNHYFASSSAAKIEYESIRSNSVIKGWDNSATGYIVNFSKTYSNPIVVSTINTRSGADGGWLRRRSISGSSIALVVDEDKAVDTERSHATERAGVLLFSEPFDAEFIYSGQAEMLINEVMYKEATTGTSNEEFVELYVTTSGNVKGMVISDQDTHFYTFPSFNVLVGDYVIYHTGTGINTSSGGVHQFYQGASNIWNNANDDVVLLKPSQDITELADGKFFNAVPFDYMAYGRNSLGGNIDAIPTSLQGTTLSWSYTKGSELKNAADGESISLTPNATDSDKAACWERSTSGNASNNSCAGYIITKDTDASANINSLGNSNTASPIITLTKTVLTIYDPFNDETNPKAIPGSILEYTIAAKNDGDLAADNNTIKIADLIPVNTKLCVTNTGSCKAPYFVNGSPSSGLNLASTTYSNNNGTSYVYSASPDADGADANVTNLLSSMNGAFQPKTGATAPNFSLKFRVVVE